MSARGLRACKVGVGMNMSARGLRVKLVLE